MCVMPGRGNDVGRVLLEVLAWAGRVVGTTSASREESERQRATEAANKEREERKKALVHYDSQWISKMEKD